MSDFVGDEECYEFLRKKLDEGMELPDAMFALAEAAFEAGNMYRGHYTTQEALALKRPPDTVRIIG